MWNQEFKTQEWPGPRATAWGRRCGTKTIPFGAILTGNRRTGGNADPEDFQLRFKNPWPSWVWCLGPNMKNQDRINRGWQVLGLCTAYNFVQLYMHTFWGRLDMLHLHVRYDPWLIVMSFNIESYTSEIFAISCERRLQESRGAVILWMKT